MDNYVDNLVSQSRTMATDDVNKMKVNLGLLADEVSSLNKRFVEAQHDRYLMRCFLSRNGLLPELTDFEDGSGVEDWEKQWRESDAKLAGKTKSLRAALHDAEFKSQRHAELFDKCKEILEFGDLGGVVKLLTRMINLSVNKTHENLHTDTVDESRGDLFDVSYALDVVTFFAEINEIVKRVEHLEKRSATQSEY